MAVQRPYEGIVVLGMPRSGTTLFRRILDAHPDVCCPPETNLLNAASRFLTEHQASQGLTVGVLSGLSFSGYDEEQILERLRDFVFGFYEEIRERNGKPLWAEKTAFDSFHLDGIFKLCGPRCRYVCLYRHGLDAVCSIRELCDKLGVYFPELHEHVIRHNSPLHAFAHAWSEVNGNLLKLTREHSDLAVGVRYEDLVADPSAELARVFDFLGRPTDVDVLLDKALESESDVGFGDWKTYQTRKISTSSIGRWKKALDPRTVSDLGAIINPLMAQLRYEEIEDAGEPDDEEARRRLQLGLMIAKMNVEKQDGQEGDPGDQDLGGN